MKTRSCYNERAETVVGNKLMLRKIFAPTIELDELKSRMGKIG
jgi:hypothetical protein